MFRRYCLIGVLLLVSRVLIAASHHPDAVLLEAKKDVPGRGVYLHFCANCHEKTPKIKLGAPRFRQEKEWAIRLKQPRNQMFTHLDEGFNAMPARGGCFECSDADLWDALNYMLPRTKTPVKKVQ